MSASRHPRHVAGFIWFLAGAILAALGYGVTAGIYARSGEIHNDEGFYAYASKEVMRGRIPYRDFAYTQSPVLPYVQGSAMAGVGYGVRQQRWLNVVWGMLGIIFASVIWRRAGAHPLTSLVLVAVWCACPHLMYYGVIGKTYALATVLLLAAAATLYLRTSAPAKLWLFSAACVLAVGCRLTKAPAVFVLWCGFVLLERRRLSLLTLVAVPLLWLVALLGPFIAADPRNFYFWCIEIHLLGALPKVRFVTLIDSFTTVLPVTLMAATALVLLFPVRAALQKPSTWIFLAGGIGWILAVLLPGVYADYATPFYPLVIVGFTALFVESGQGRVKWIGAGAIALSALWTARGAKEFLKGDYLASVDRTSAYVRQTTRPDDKVLTSMPEIALGAGREIYPPLEMGKFSLTGEMDVATSSRRHLMTWAELQEVVDEQRAPIIVFARRKGANFSWSIPSQLRFDPTDYRSFAERLLLRYHCTYADDYFLVFERAQAKPEAFNIDASAL